MISFIVWDVSPQIFQSFELLRWYGIFWAIGAIAGFQLLTHIYQKEHIPVAEIDKLATYVLIGGILGARLGHILFYDPIYYWNNPIEVLPFKINPTFQFTGLAGLASHGGVFAALIALYLYDRKYKKGFFWLLDRLTIAAVVLGGFIRVGNLMNSEIVGTATNVPWAFIFTQVDATPRHPAQLYEALCYFLIGFILYRIWKTTDRAKNQGFISGLGLVMIFSQRFFVEFVKKNQVAFEEELVLNMGQMLSIPLVLVGILILVLSLKKPLNKT